MFRFKFINILHKLCIPLLLLTAQNVYADHNNERLVIADTRGDWGALAPYLHKPKGKGYMYTSFVFDTLLWKDKQGKITPALAKHWKITNDGLHYRFTLRDDARWHDGHPIEAEDIAFTIQYMMQHRYHFADMSSIKTATAHSKYEVDIYLKHPYAPFLSNIAANIPILPQHHYHTIQQPKRFKKPEAMIGSGPYRLVKFDRTQGRYHLKRNEHYYAWKPRYDEVHIVKMSPDAALAAMKRGEVHFMNTDHKHAHSFEKAGFTLRSRISNHPRRLLFNHQGRFKKPELRHAIAHAIDKKSLVDLAYLGHAQVASAGYFQPKPLAKSINFYMYNPNQATTEFKAAGWELNSKGQWEENGQTIVLDLMAPPKFSLLAKAVATQLENFGIKIRLRLEKGAQLTQRLRKQDFDLAILSISHNGDPDRFRRLLTSPSALSDGYFANAQLTDLLQRQAQTNFQEERFKLLAQAEKIYNQDLPSFPLVNPMSYMVFSSKHVNPHYNEQGVASGISIGLDKVHLFAPHQSLNQ